MKLFYSDRELTRKKYAFFQANLITTNECLLINNFLLLLLLLLKVLSYNIIIVLFRSVGRFLFMHHRENAD